WNEVVMRCRTAHSSIIAARDGELGARRRRALDRHLARCGTCRAEQVAIDDVLAALARLPDAIDVPARLEPDVLRRIRALAADPDARGATASRWLRVLTPALAAGVVAAGAVLGLRTVTEQAPTVRTTPPVVVATRESTPPPARRAKTRVPDQPPAELASHPELFVDLPMLRNMDKLQHFDTIA